ncbi:MAG: hypothetical protein LKI25_04835 [Atopobiaceae bacterium]|jgi:hypothetical protein|nr:hypothetical protein [Atopobiaceae bacterium]
MRKSNVIVFACAAAASVALLAAWYALGLDRVDSPTDLVLSVVWWVAIAAIAALVARAERRRRREVRTIYVSPTSLYNSERGVVAVADPSARVGAMEDILSNLSYGFDRADMPSSDEFDCEYVVESDEYRPADSSSDAEASDPDWRGTVVRVDRARGNHASAFDGRPQLEETFK